MWRRRPPSLREILRRRQHQDGAEEPAKILAEVLLIAGEQVRGPGLEGSLEDRLIFLREAYPRRQRKARNDPDSFQEFGQPLPLIFFHEVQSGFFGGVSGSQQLHPFQLPQASHASGGPVGG